ncbi:MAG TPA: porin PorA family protein [Marmoricola sp.]|nr:porin PorA family protein [Marmoricola sp.]
MRKWGITLAVAGVLMLVAGAVLRFVVVPREQVLPADTNDTVTYTGDLTTVDVAAMLGGGQNAVVQLPVTVARTLKVLQTSGDKARVSDTAIMKSDRGTVPPSLARTEYFYAVDRSSLAAIPNFTDQPVTKAKGLVVSFPIGTEKKAYTGWVAELGTTAAVKYTGQDTLKGLTVYTFAGRTTEPMPTPPEGLPTALPKAQLGALAKALQLPAAVQQQLAQALPALPDPVPLTYTFTEGDTYSVEPDTGVIVDMTKNVRIAVGLGDLPLQPIPALVLGLKYNDASVTDMAAKASDARDQVRLYGTWLPAGLGLLGLVCLGAAVALLRRRPEGGTGHTVPGAPERHPSPVG